MHKLTQALPKVDDGFAIIIKCFEIVCYETIDEWLSAAKKGALQEMKQNSRLGYMLMMFMAILKIRDDRNKLISEVTANQ